MEKVIRYLRENQDRFVKELSEYLRFPSVSAQLHHREDLAAAAAWLVNHCRKIGLETRLCPTQGNPVVIATTRTPGGKRRPRFLVYGHYDVQPPEPLELWATPPFEPRIAMGAIFARGAADNKGQHFAHLKAVEAFLKTGTELPCDITFIIEGEEEVGSKSLAPFLRERRNELRCDGIVVSDTGLISLKHPTLTYALRGILAVELKVHGPSRDLHSGIFGGSVENPAMALCRILARLRDKKGRVAIPGFYDNVEALTKFERRELGRQPFDAKAYRRFLGVPEAFGEAGFTSIEQRSARPTIEINGLTSGYQGQGSKTIIPAWASAKLTMRLVPDQKPGAVFQLFKRHCQKLCPPSVRLEIVGGHGGEPYYVSPDSPQSQAALRALRLAFGHPPVLMREGGSIPIVNDFKKILRADTLLLGLSLPDDNAHSPNEKFDLEAFEKGQLMSVHLWKELAESLA